MPEKIYLCIIVAVILGQFFKPTLSIAAIVLIFSLKTHVLFPAHLDYRLSLIIGATFLISVALRGFNGKNPDAVLYMISFIFICITSTILNGNFSKEVLANVFELFKSLGFALLILSCKLKKNDLILLMLAFIAAGLANGVYALIQQVENSGISGYRSVGFQNQPNGAGLCMYMSLPFVYFFYSQSKNWLIKISAIATIVVFFLGIIATGSRASMLAALLICGLLFIKNIKRPFTVILIAGALYFCAGLAVDTFSERAFVKSNRSGGKLDSSVSARLSAIEGALLLWIYNPLLGVGPMNYMNARTEQFKLHGRGAKLQAHNTFLQVLAETGILGMIIFIGLLLKGFKALKLCFDGESDFFKEIAACTKIFLFVLLFASVVINGMAKEIYWIYMTIPFIVRGAYLGEKEMLARSRSKTA